MDKHSIQETKATLKQKPSKAFIYFIALLLCLILIASAVCIAYRPTTSVQSSADPAQSSTTPVQSSTAPAQSSTTAAQVNLADYFVITSRPYYDQHKSTLGELATSLHYFDFDNLVKDLYGNQYGRPTCTPIECGNGDMIYDYIFYTPCWKVELCTQVENLSDTICSWIVLSDPKTGEIRYESPSEKVPYRVGNYVSNLRVGTTSGENHLFLIERSIFVKFLAFIGDQVFTSPTLPR